MKKKANKKQKRWCQTWSYKVGGEKATKETSRIFHCYSMPQRTKFELPKYKRLEGIIDGGGPRRPHYLPNTIIEWWEKKRKSKKGDAKHGLVRWVEQKQQNKLVGFFIAIPYLKGLILNYQNIEDKGIIDGGGPRCSHLPNTIIEWWENEKRKENAKHGLVRWVEWKQQSKLARLFVGIPYLKGLILNYQNTEYLKESLMVVDPDVHIICQTP